MNSFTIRSCFAPLMVATSWLLIPGAAADDKPVAPQPIKHQITGLFMKERAQDLREAVDKIPKIKLVSIDFENAEAAFAYDAAQAFPGAKPDQIVGRLDSALKSASNHTFGIKPLRSVPLEKLQLIKIPVAGLDCKACSLAAYEAVAKLDGVERATASFREGLVTALIDPGKIDRAKLEEALKKLGVQLLAPRALP
jgi:copper chaperone CopZ